MTNPVVAEYRWKDLQGLKNEGVYLSTPSDEAAKMFDAINVQLVGWYGDQTLGGIPGTLKKMKDADPDCVLVPMLESSLQFSNHRPETNPEMKASLEEMEQLAKKRTLTQWELTHVEAVRQLTKGYVKKAFEINKKLLLENPLDLFTLRNLFLLSLYFGQIPEVRGILEPIMPHWKPHMAMYGYVQGMYAFTLNESKRFEEAEKCAKKALEINPCDIWSTHVTAHIMDNTDRAEQGRMFMEKNEHFWKTGDILLSHNYWHWALFHVEKGDFEGALSILDKQIIPRCDVGAHAALRDGSSLLYRLHMEGVPTGDRFETLKTRWLPTEHTWVFSDVHRMMTFLGANDLEAADSLLQSCDEFLRNGDGTNWEALKDVGKPFCEGMMAFDKGQYDDAFELLYPVVKSSSRIGGSNSQRDVLELLLLRSAFESTKDKNRKLATALLKERKDRLGNTGQTQRIEEHFMQNN